MSEAFEQQRETRWRFRPRHPHMPHAALVAANARHTRAQESLELAAIEVPPDPLLVVVVKPARRLALGARPRLRLPCRRRRPPVAVSHSTRPGRRSTAIEGPRSPRQVRCLASRLVSRLPRPAPSRPFTASLRYPPSSLSQVWTHPRKPEAPPSIRLQLHWRCSRSLSGPQIVEFMIVLALQSRRRRRGSARGLRRGPQRFVACSHDE
jgi:hypothetical protein